MKSFLVIAIFALVGFCFSSAASIDTDENEIPESVGVYKSTLESILQDGMKQIRENLAFGENMVFDNFDQGNMFDDEQSVTFTEEEEGEEEEEEATNDDLSPVKDVHSTKNVGSGISCSWQGHNGQCCQSLRIIKLHIRICLGISVRPPSYMQLQLTLNGKTIWRRQIGVRSRSLKFCHHMGLLKICFKLDNLHISSHYAKICLGIAGKVGRIPFHKNLGCIEKRFALHEIPTITNEPNPFSVHKKHNYELLSHGYEENNVLKFEMA